MDGTTRTTAWNDAWLLIELVALAGCLATGRWFGVTCAGLAAALNLGRRWH